MAPAAGTCRAGLGCFLGSRRHLLACSLARHSAARHACAHSYITWAGLLLSGGQEQSRIGPFGQPPLLAAAAAAALECILNLVGPRSLYAGRHAARPVLHLRAGRARRGGEAARLGGLPADHWPPQATPLAGKGWLPSTQQGWCCSSQLDACLQAGLAAQAAAQVDSLPQHLLRRSILDVDMPRGLVYCSSAAAGIRVREWAGGAGWQ